MVGGQRHATAALAPGKTRYPLHRRLGEPHSRSGISAVVLEMLRAVNGVTETTKVLGIFL